MMRILTNNSNFISKILTKQKKDDEKLKDDFDKIIDECEKDIRPKEQKDGDYQNNIRKVIDDAKEPEEIFKRSNIIKGWMDNEEILDDTKEIISLNVIEGYFGACKSSIKEGKKDISKKYFECGIEAYNNYPYTDNKAAFRALLEYIDFKTGPLSEEDIRNKHLYYEGLYENEFENLRTILMKTGVYGISGSRGTGKSTLLHAAINEIKKRKIIRQPLVVELAVPSEYKTEEQFLTALLSKICEKTIKKGDWLDHLMNFSYKLFYLFLFSLGILFLLYEIFPAIFPEIDYEQLISVTVPATGLIGLLATSSLIVSMAFISNRSHTMRLQYILDYIHVHFFHVNRIYNDIKFIKTSEIIKGAESQYFSFSRRITFQENPINYSAPLLSDKIKELIQEHILKIFDKVIIIIDDFDKLVDESARINILKSIRFLSSTKNCLTFIAVPEGFERRIYEDSEVRTLFDQFIVLHGIEDEKKLKDLLKYRIMTYNIGEIFLEKLIENKEKDDRFYSVLLNKSRRIPREAIRYFDKCFQDWLNLAIKAEKFKFIDKSLFYEPLFSWDKIPGEDTEKLREFLTHNFLIPWIKSAKIEKVDGGKAIRVSTESNSLTLGFNNKKPKYVFSWAEVPGNDSGRLIEHLKQEFRISWVETAKIEKINDGRTIRVTDENNYLSLGLSDEKTKVNLKIEDGRSAEFIAKSENGKLNIYKPKLNLEIDDDRTCEFTVKIDNDGLYMDFEESP